MDQKSQSLKCRICHQKRRGQNMAKNQNVQTLTRVDLNAIEALIERKIQPVVDMAKETRQEVVGIDGRNGLKGTMVTMLPRREAYIVITTITILSTLFTNFNSCQNSKGIQQIQDTQKQEQTQGK